MESKNRFATNGSRASFLCRLLGALTALALVLVVPTQTVAQQSESIGSTGGPLAIKVIGDKILARVELQTEVWIKDTHIIIDYDMPHTMMFQSCVLGNLRFGEGEESLKVLNENFRLEIPKTEIIPEIGATCGELTGKYDKFLDQIDIVAIVGWPVLREFGLTLDIQDGSMTLHPEGELVAEEVRASSELFTEGVEVIGDSVYIPTNYNGGQRAFMKMSTNGYHTVLNRELLDDREAGVVDEAYLGTDQTIKVSDMAAFYPQDLYQKWYDQYAADKQLEDAVREQLKSSGMELPDAYKAKAPDHPSGDVLLVSGLSVLSGYRIVLDHNQGFVGISQTVNSNYSDADHQFYMAAAAQDEDQLFTYLEENPQDRNVEEAVDVAFNLGLENGATIERQAELIEYGLAVNEQRRQFMYVANYVLGLGENPDSRNEHSDLIISLGEIALPFVGNSDQPKYRQQVQQLIGDRHLARGENTLAWKYFLSAAFNGDPELDAITRFDLGRAYEALGRDSRAIANYDRALSKGLPRAQAKSASDAITRLQDRLESDESVSTASEDG